MARGFKSIDQELGWIADGSDIGDFIQIDYGYGTGWSLLCEYSRKERSFWVVIKNPISYRVHDERELIAYWDRRKKEGVVYSFAYEIEESVYLDELKMGITGLIGEPLRHFLMGGMNTCVEVISIQFPLLVFQRPEQARKNW